MAPWLSRLLRPILVWTDSLFRPMSDSVAKVEPPGHPQEAAISPVVLESAPSVALPVEEEIPVVAALKAPPPPEVPDPTDEIPQHPDSLAPIPSIEVVPEPTLVSGPTLEEWTPTPTEKEESPKEPDPASTKMEVEEASGLLPEETTVVLAMPQTVEVLDPEPPPPVEPPSKPTRSRSRRTRPAAVQMPLFLGLAVQGAPLPPLTPLWPVGSTSSPTVFRPPVMPGVPAYGVSAYPALPRTSWGSPAFLGGPAPLSPPPQPFFPQVPANLSRVGSGAFPFPAPVSAPASPVPAPTRFTPASPSALSVFTPQTGQGRPPMFTFRPNMRSGANQALPLPQPTASAPPSNPSTAYWNFPGNLSVTYHTYP